MSKYVKRKRRAKAPSSLRKLTDLVTNPLDWGITSEVLPGFAAYAAGRVVARGAYVVARKKWPGAAKHAPVAASWAAFLLAWLAGGRWDALKPWHKSIVVGSAVAALQQTAQTYLPQFAWLVGDIDEKQYVVPAQAQPAQQFLTPVDLDLPELEPPAAQPSAADVANAQPIQQDDTPEVPMQDDDDLGVVAEWTN